MKQSDHLCDVLNTFEHKTQLRTFENTDEIMQFHCVFIPFNEAEFTHAA